MALGLTAGTALSAYLIIPHEGEVRDKDGYHVAYVDPVGIHTACWGQTGKDHLGRTIRQGMKYTDEDCTIMLGNSLMSFEKQINSLVKVPYTSPYQQAAVTSFTYNVGVGSLRSSTLLRMLNAKEYDKACEQLTRWVYAKKQILKGLVTRRTVEYKWCMGDVPLTIEQAYQELLPVLLDHEREKEK